MRTFTPSAGTVVIGWGRTPDNQEKCARWDREGRPTVLGLPPFDIGSMCFDINDSGTVVGESINYGTVRPVYWDASATPFLLPSPPSLMAIVAQHINDRGNTIVGYGYDSVSYTYRGIAWRRSRSVANHQ